MAKTDDMIDSLVKNLRPVRKGALRRLLLLALIPGLMVSTALVLMGHGLRPDLEAALSVPAFWVKAAYPLLLTVVSIGALISVARPGGRPVGAVLPLAIIYGLLVVLGVVQLGAASPGQYRSLIMGISYWACPLIILVVGAPVMTASFWFLRRSAPTNPRLAGLVAGMTAGSLGAVVYSWGCIENGLAFVALWYTLGIVLCAGVGALLGRPLLRW